MAASLESGVLVSRYSIVGPIGAGGMGEVYKAQDSSLERMVALKILPPDVVRNDERRRRFIQEARSASSLNHPHIVTIHEIGEATVEPSGQVIHYIAMELIDGATLKKKIHQEQTDLRTIVSYLAQAADGLAKAHAAGIVHRDLKPENIMVTRDGFAKVLDFGLAKLSVRKSATETIDTTAVREETREGAVLGTVAYMAPEQVMGKVVDHRCDIFSFGSILYEAATRRRPFEADSDVDVMHKILHDNPQPIEIDGNVPTELRRIIRRCLAKDPERRYQSMKDLAIDLRDLVENYDELSVSATSQGSSSPTAVVAPVAKSNTVVWISAAVAVIALAALGWVYFRSRDGAAQTAAGPAPHTLKIQRLTSSGNVTHARISPDGRYLAMVVRDRDGNLSLRVRQVATGSDVEIAPSSPRLFAGVAFSPTRTTSTTRAATKRMAPSAGSIRSPPSAERPARSPSMWTRPLLSPRTGNRWSSDGACLRRTRTISSSPTPTAAVRALRLRFRGSERHSWEDRHGRRTGRRSWRRAFARRTAHSLRSSRSTRPPARRARSDRPSGGGSTASRTSRTAAVW